MEDNLITIAIRRQEQAEILCKLLEQHDIKAVINEINKDHARVGDGVRVRIHESDLVKALAVIEQQQELDLENIESQEPVQNILIPYDFTLHSHNACMIGFKLAKLMNAKITIIHAYFVTTALYEISTSSMFEPNLYKNISLINDKFKELKHELEELIANEKLPNIPFNFISAEGLPEDVINDYCKKNRPQLVIIDRKSVV